MDVPQLFEHLLRRSRGVQAAEKLDRFGLRVGVGLQLTVGLLKLGIELVTLHAAQMAVGKVIVVVDRVPHRFQMSVAQLGGFTSVL